VAGAVAHRPLGLLRGAKAVVHNGRRGGSHAGRGVRGRFAARFPGPRSGSRGKQDRRPRTSPRPFRRRQEQFPHVSRTNRDAPAAGRSQIKTGRKRGIGTRRRGPAAGAGSRLPSVPRVIGRRRVPRKPSDVERNESQRRSAVARACFEFRGCPGTGGSGGGVGRARAPKMLGMPLVPKQAVRAVERGGKGAGAASLLDHRDLSWAGTPADSRPFDQGRSLAAVARSGRGGEPSNAG